MTALAVLPVPSPPAGSIAERPVRAVDDAPEQQPDVLWLPADEQSPRHARHHVAAVLAGWGVDADTVDDAELLVSELVTNVRQHSASTHVGVGLAATIHRVTVSVYESGATGDGATDHITDEVRRPAPLGATSGRGLKILDTLATEWGLSRTGMASSTWFALTPAHRLPLAAVDPVSHAEAVAREAALARTELLLTICEDLSRAHDAAGVGAVVTRRLRGLLGALFVGIVVAEPDGGTLHYVSLDQLPDATASRWSRIAHDGTTPASAAVLGARIVSYSDAAAVEADFPGLAAERTRAGVAASVHLPLTVAGRTFGALAVCWAEPVLPDDDTLVLLRIVAGYTAHALRRADGP